MLFEERKKEGVHLELGYLILAHAVSVDDQNLQQLHRPFEQAEDLVLEDYEVIRLPSDSWFLALVLVPLRLIRALDLLHLCLLAWHSDSGRM